jgi:hypothetical protein
MNRIVCSLVAVLVGTTLVLAQGPPRRHQAWGGGCRVMLDEMKAGDARLDEKLAAMNAAKGNDRVDAIAALLNELVSQRKAMHEKMSASPPGGCPMMQ